MTKICFITESYTGVNRDGLEGSAVTGRGLCSGFSVEGLNPSFC